MKSLTKKSVLISGASFAGLCSAYWMDQMGYQVTLVEINDGLKKGGTPVNILGNTMDIAKRMGILEKIRANKLSMEFMEFKNAADVTERLEYTQQKQEERVEVEYEIERDVLLHMLYDLVKNKVEFIFGDSIISLKEEDSAVSVAFKKAQNRSFHLVLGCDGIHSAVRRLWFGEESEFSHFLQTYASIIIVNKLLIPENTTQLYSEPGKTVMLNTYNGKTDIVLCFYSEQEIPYDYRNEQQQRAILTEHFAGTGWRTPELLEEIKKSKTLYFDKLCQLKMPSWTKGRVALVGDAAYCASPAAGRGGSLAIDGAAALADAFLKYPSNLELAFKEYNSNFRPFIEEIRRPWQALV
jgi:2-polyprenyl-6-methoxyphenol hydroxylase-like FAD-dependent oxidoreductase